MAIARGLRTGHRQQRDDHTGPQAGEALAGPMALLAVGPQGGEIRVNSFTTGSQANPAIAILSDGSWVVAWTSTGQDGSGDGVYAQRFAADGTPAGTEFRVATTTADDQRTPALTALSGGGFVITWENRVGGANAYDVYGQRYDSGGTAQGGEFLVNQTTASFQGKSAVAGFSGGGFVVTWQSTVGESTEVFARRFNADGSPAGAEFGVNSFTSGEQDEPAVAVLAGGGFVITWQSENQDGSSRGVYAQLYNASGAPVGTEFRANTTTANVQGLPSVTALEGGGFVIVWGGVAVRGQIYTADGTPVGGEIVIATGFNGVSVTAMAGGGFAVTWDEIASGGAGDGAGFAVVARAFNASGQPLGDEPAIVNETTAGDQRTGGHGSLVQLADGSVAVVWAGNGTEDSSGVFVRRYELGGDVAGPAPIVGTSGVDTLTGTAGDDVIRGLGSDDSIDGLGGSDIAEYRGVRSDYRVTLRDGVYTVDDQREGSPDGTDALTNVEFLRFSDGETIAIGDALAPAATPSLDPLTGAILINATPEPSAIFPMTVALSGGGYAVVWLGDFAIQNNPATLRGRAFNAAGQPVGDEFTVGDMDFLSEEQVPSLTALAGGGFAVTWMSPSDDIFDQYQDLQIQIYSAVGAPVGERINAGSTGRFSTPVLVGTADGGFLLVRDPENGTDNFSTTGQFFNAAGMAMGSAFPVAANVGDHVSAAILANGDIVMAWNEPPQSLGEKAYVRLFSPTGQPRSDSFIVDLAQPGGQNVPSVAALAGGGFVITWFHSNPDSDIYARIFDAAGNPVTGSFTVNENTAGTQWYGYVEALEDGGFVVSWTGADGSSDGVFARAFDASGQPRGGEVLINAYVPGNQEAEIRNLAQLNNGDLIFSWTGPGADGPGVFTRRFILGEGQGPAPIVGTSGPDDLSGTAGNDTINGLGGDDILRGEEGNDTLNGNDGDDTLNGGGGDDLLDGGDGGDNLVGGAGNDYLNGGAGADYGEGGDGNDAAEGFAGNDILFGNAGNDNLIGGDGVDYINGGAGGDYAEGGLGNDAIEGEAGADILFGQDGDDNILGGGDDDYLNGGLGGDYLDGGAGNDAAEGGEGNDIAFGGDGDDNLLGQNGDDYLNGGAGADYLEGGAGNDTFEAGTGSDIMIGGDGIDTLLGGDGDDYAEGGTGDDSLFGNLGNDTLVGGAGADRFVFDSAPGLGNSDTIVDFTAGADKIHLDDAVFGGLTPGALSPNAFRIGTAAQDADDRILYDAATGALLYDADGSGGGAAVQFATLSGAPALTAADFVVF